MTSTIIQALFKQSFISATYIGPLIYLNKWFTREFVRKSINFTRQNVIHFSCNICIVIDWNDRCHLGIPSVLIPELSKNNKIIDIMSSVHRHWKSLINNKIFNKICEQINTLWPSDTICQHRSGSILAQVMACCLMARSHYLNQCWFIISKVHWHSCGGIFQKRYLNYR